MDAATWEKPDPGEVRVLGSGSDWDNFAKEYERLLADDQPGQHMGPHMRPFNRCLEVARANGATSVVVETRYLDLDYRSEFSSYYSRGFRTPPHSARRLHFFRAPLRDEQLWDLPNDAGYLGYVVVRPVSLGPVGRTMLRPPPAMQEAVRTAVTETVTLFGQPLPITAVPFMQQDAQLDRCAHAAAWTCHYSAYRRNEVSRRSMASFSLMADSSLSVGRAVPSEGLTVLQLLELLRLFDLPCQYYDIENLPSIAPGPGTPPEPTPALDGHGNRLPAGRWDTRIISICCRYLNSGVPVLVGNQGTDAHAWTLCGYERQARPNASDWIRFVRHDDQRGPYLWVDDVLNDQIPGDYEYSPWRYLLVPLPEKLWLTPGPAEGSAALLLPSLAQALVSAIPGGAAAQELLDRVAAGEFRLRTYSRPANEFKNGLLGRVDPVVQREYRMARFPRYIWVVEAIDRVKRSAGVAECVIGEAILDGTSSGLRPQVLALHVPGAMVIYPTDEPFRGPIMCSPDAYRTGGIGPT